MITEFKFTDESDIRLDNYLKLQFKHLSRTKIQKLILNGKIKVDDFIVKPSFVLKPNQIITYDEKPDIKENNNYLIPEKMNIEILFEDEDIIAVNKTAGLVVHPGAGNKRGTLLNGLMHRYKNDLSSIDKSRPGVVHRLDKFTSGIILFAKTDFSHYSLSNQFAERKIKKKYNALVWGKISEGGHMNNMITRDPNNRLKYKVSNNNKGKVSLTDYTINKSYNLPITLLDIFPHTGRTHQIRVHLSNIGHPILNDSLYGGSSDKLKSFDSKYKSRFLKIFKKIKRVALHAQEINFFHPVKKKQITISSPLPDDFLQSLTLLEEYED